LKKDFLSIFCFILDIAFEILFYILVSDRPIRSKSNLNSDSIKGDFKIDSLGSAGGLSGSGFFKVQKPYLEIN
jgi:hypothetical protein